MHLLENAIQSICVGVEDFNTLKPERMLSSVRNIHAGILLLYKEKLRMLSPTDSNEVLVKEKISPVRSSDGIIKLIGEGKNTASIFQIKERFKNLDVQVDWKSFDDLSHIINNIEHYYSDIESNRIREDLAKSFVLIRDFIQLNLTEEPLKMLGQECWNTLIEIETIFIREQGE